MTPRSKAKGSAAERALVDYLRRQGWPYAERRLAGATNDRGDVAGMPGVVVEVKNCERTELAAWVDEAATEQANDGADYGVVIHKRRGRGDPGQWFLTMPVAQGLRLLRAAGYGTPLATAPSGEVGA